MKPGVMDSAGAVCSIGNSLGEPTDGPIGRNIRYPWRLFSLKKLIFLAVNPFFNPGYEAIMMSKKKQAATHSLPSGIAIQIIDVIRRVCV